jgi:Abortive infection C-terminus
MGSGYVLNFSDRTFSEFFDEHTRIDIDAQTYRERGTSKANRLRSFWAIEGNHLVGKVIEAMILYGQSEDCVCKDNDLRDLTDNCWKVAKRLLLDTPVAELDALTATVDERDFETVAQHIREAIENNQPEAALDRLHIFVFKYVRTLCEIRGIDVNRDKPLHSTFGEYVKHLRDTGHLESVMTERIIKSSISVLDAFNDVRNNKSLAHDNPILNYEESLLIFNHVASSIRFIKSLEARIKHESKSVVTMDDDLPF